MDELPSPPTSFPTFLEIQFNFSLKITDLLEEKVTGLVNIGFYTAKYDFRIQHGFLGWARTLSVYHVEVR